MSYKPRKLSNVTATTNPAALISSLFRQDFHDTSVSSNASSHSSEPSRKRRRSIHEEYKTLLEQGKLQLYQMDKAEPFIYWLMDGPKKIAIYCKVCEKFLGPNKGGSYFTHVRTCKNLIYPGTLPSAPITDQQKEEFSFTVVDAIDKDLNLFTQLNTEAFKQCIQKALIIGFESKQPGYGPPDASELFNNNNGSEMDLSYSYDTTTQEDDYSNASNSDNLNSLKNDIFNLVNIKTEETSPPIEIPTFDFGAGSRKMPSPSSSTAFTIGEEIFYANEYTDVILRTSDEKEIPAHRCFLSNASPVLKNFFETMPGNPTKIEIEFDKSTTQRALQYCYGIESVVDGYEFQLLPFATCYEIQKLKDQCISRMESTLSPSTVCEIIKVAYEHNYEALKQKCVQMIVNNKGIVGKDQINSLPPPILCDILFAQ